MQIHTVHIVQRHNALSRKHIFSISKKGRIMPPANVNIISPNINPKQDIDIVMALLETSYVSL